VLSPFPRFFQLPPVAVETRHSLIESVSNKLPKTVIVIDLFSAFFLRKDDNLVHQTTNPKRPSFASFFPKRAQGKALNSLSGFDYKQPF
jgi:hypothetical protein